MIPAVSTIVAPSAMIAMEQEATTSGLHAIDMRGPQL